MVEGGWTNTDCFYPKVAKLLQSTCISCGEHRTLCDLLTKLCQAMPLAPVSTAISVTSLPQLAISAAGECTAEKIKSLEPNARCCLLTRLAAISHSSFCAAVALYTARIWCTLCIMIILFTHTLSVQAFLVCFRAGMSSLEQVTSLSPAVGCHQHKVCSIQLDQAPAAHLC